ncbi:clarin-3 [Austrofundulus limnaeus]|uniref:Clarin-3 n=1 Tax=Austrofundulus limnaeus TaxID=52670 RepID=A0A2I4B459_AUSLI|nr:PREDICTED: clarin-3 [Austrofundulus limnaeus]
MPSLVKTLHFLLSALITAVSVGLLGFAMSTMWSQTSMECAELGSSLYNGTANIKMSLFKGELIRVSCPTFGGRELFEVFPKLKQTGTVPLALHGLSVGLLVACLLFSALSILISLYNSVSNPYQTYMGPVGVYTCSSLSAFSSFLVLILYVLNLNVTNMQEDLVKTSSAVDLKDKRAVMQVGYFLLIPYTVLSVIAIFLIYVYDHAAYTQRREQERPTEDAPKEIMMY